MGTVKLVSLEQIEVGENKVRCTDDKSSIILRLRQSISERGLLNAIVGRKIGVNRDLLIDGHLRYVATSENCKQMTEGEDYQGIRIDNLLDRYEQWSKIPMNIIDTDEEDDFKIASTANEIRLEFHPTELAIIWHNDKGEHEKLYPHTKKGGALGAMTKGKNSNSASIENTEANKEMMGYVKMKALQIGKSPSYVENILALNHLPESIKKQFRKDEDAKLSHYVDLAKKYKRKAEGRELDKDKEDNTDSKGSEQATPETAAHQKSETEKETPRDNDKGKNERQEEQSGKDGKTSDEHANGSKDKSDSQGSTNTDSEADQDTSEDSDEGEKGADQESNDDVDSKPEPESTPKYINPKHVKAIETISDSLGETASKVQDQTKLCLSDDSYLIGKEDLKALQKNVKVLRANLSKYLEAIKLRIEKEDLQEEPKDQFKSTMGQSISFEDDEKEETQVLQ